MIIAFTLQGCSFTEDYNDTPIEEYLIGTWVRELNHREFQSGELPVVSMTQYTGSHEGNYLTYSFRKNKVFEYPFKDEYELNDSTIKYLDDGYFNGDDYWNEYKIERVSKECFKLIAKFPVHRYSSYPERDSILTYRRVHDHNEYLDSLVQNGSEKPLTCKLEDKKMIYGYWKKDSTENISYVSERKYDYMHIDSSGHIDDLWLGRKPSVRTIGSHVGDNFIMVDGYALNVRCATENSLIIDWNTELPFYEIEYYSRVDPKIIPDSLKRKN